MTRRPSQPPEGAEELHNDDAPTAGRVIGKTRLGGGAPIAPKPVRTGVAGTRDEDSDALIDQLFQADVRPHPEGIERPASAVRASGAEASEAPFDTDFAPEESERETQLFSKSYASDEPSSEEPDSLGRDAPPPAEPSWGWKRPDAGSLDPGGFDPAPAKQGHPTALEEQGGLDCDLPDDGLGVIALPPDRGSTEELDIDDIELVGDVADLFEVLPPEIPTLVASNGPDSPTHRDALRESEGATDFAEDEGDDEPTTIPPALSGSEATAEPPGDEAPPVASAGDFARRGTYPRIELPVIVEEALVPPPDPSLPFALVPAGPDSDSEIDVLIDDLEFADGPAPPSRASLVAARQSVAGWLASGDSVQEVEDAEEIVLSIDEIEESAVAAPPTSSAAEEVSTEIFVSTGQEFDAAVVGLVERGQRQSWLLRARRMLEEAPTGDAQLRASTLLVVSELLAIGGEAEEAEKVAEEALGLAPNSPMVQRQLRGLLAVRRAWPEVSTHLSRELRTAPSQDAMAHAAFLAAELARVAQDDPKAAGRFIDRGAGGAPEDVRGSLARWAAAGGELDAKLQPPTGPSEERFASAALNLAALRSNGAEGAGASSMFARLLAARAGLRRRQPALAVEFLDTVASEPGLAGASSWLAAALGAAEEALSVHVLHALERASRGSHRALARRSLVAHSLERSHHETVAHAIRSGEELAPVDRLILSAMLPTDVELPAPTELLVAALDADTDELPIVAAAAAALGAPMPMTVAPGDEVGKLRAALARQLVRLLHEPSPEEALRILAPTAAALLEFDPDDGAARAWTIERRFVTKQLAAVGEALAGGDDEQRAIAAGLFAEISVPPAPLPTALSSLASENEAALQMVASRVSAGEAATLLESFASRTEDASSALFLTAAACRLPPDLPRADQLWIRAHERDPNWPVAPLFAFAAALRVKNESSAGQWLARCGLDPVQEQILIGLRVNPPGSRERLAVLEDAHLRRPHDYALRDQLELASGGRADRASWLYERATERTGGASSLALEAALLFELEGDGAAAANAANLAQDQAPSPLAEVMLRRLARAGHGADAVCYRLESALLRAEDPSMRRDLAAELARIEDRGRRDGAAAARRWREAIEAGATDVATLLEAERALMSLDAPAAQANVEIGLARALAGQPEALAHAMLAVRRATRSGDLALAFDAAQVAVQSTRRSSWSLRHLAALAHVRRDHDGLWRACIDLAERTARPQERAALLCRASEAALALGDTASAGSLLDEVTRAWPRHPIARLLRATLLERAGATLEAAVAYEELAGMSRSRKDRAERCYKAAGLWLASNDARAAVEGQRLLEAACDLDPDHAKAFERLQSIYLAGGARMELAELLSQRVRNVDDPMARGELEVLRGKMLAEAGASSEAKVALAASLKVRPDDVEGWRAYAEVSYSEGDGDSAEQALLQLGRILTDAKGRADVFLRLGDVYARLKPNLDRAARSYREAEKLDPSRIEVKERLIELQAMRGDRVGALSAQREMCDGAKTPQEFVARTISLAWLHERLGDLGEAERLLGDLRRHHPADPRPLQALFQHHVRAGKRNLADALVERARAEVARMMSSGQIEAGLFDVAVAAAELKGRADGVSVARSVRLAAQGGKVWLGAAEGRAASASLDDLVAPEAFGPELRELLAATGQSLEAIVPFDVLGVRTRPLTHHDELAARARSIAESYGVMRLDLLIANTLPATVVPVSTEPATLCVGAPLLDPAMQSLFDLCVHRAMLLVRTKTAAFARIAPIDQWPTLVAYLRLHDPGLPTLNADAARVSEIEGLLRSVGAERHVQPRHAELARAVMSGIGTRGSSLGSSAVAWSWRTAALASGDVGLVFDAISLATSAVGAPTSDDERIRWLGKQLEAREVVGFLLGDAFLDARSRVGVVAPT